MVGESGGTRDSILSAQFCCELKNTLKKKVYL